MFQWWKKSDNTNNRMQFDSYIDFRPEQNVDIILSSLQSESAAVNVTKRITWKKASAQPLINPSR